MSYVVGSKVKELNKKNGCNTAGDLTGALHKLVEWYLDQGCKLKQVLDEEEESILVDPLGDPLVNGYWYSSNGDSYTIWMLREGETSRTDLICTDVDPFVQGKGALFCLTVDESSP